MKARLYKPAANAMQSGPRDHGWILELPRQEAPKREPLMGWVAGGDVSGQLRLRFPSRESAVEYADKAGLSLQEFLPKVRRQIIRANGYGENFRNDRLIPWTH